MNTPLPEYYSTNRYYDQKGRRLAVFCRYLNANEAEIFTLTCSKDDQFSKKYARKVYESYLQGVDLKNEFHKPAIEIIGIEPERREIWTLLNFCRKNYYINVIAEVPMDVLIPADIYSYESNY